MDPSTSQTKTITTNNAKHTTKGRYPYTIAWHSLTAARQNLVVDRLSVTTRLQVPRVPGPVGLWLSYGRSTLTAKHYTLQGLPVS